MARTHRTAWRLIADEALRVKTYSRHQSRSGSVCGLMIEAAERALEKATDEEKKAYRMRYVEGMNPRMASDAMHVSEKTYYRILGRLLVKVEKEMA